jgi:hypothetical protein
MGSLVHHQLNASRCSHISDNSYLPLAMLICTSRHPADTSLTNDAGPHTGTSEAEANGWNLPMTATLECAAASRPNSRTCRITSGRPSDLVIVLVADFSRSPASFVSTEFAEGVEDSVTCSCTLLGSTWLSANQWETSECERGARE